MKRIPFEILEHVWMVQSINEGTMKRLELFDYYVLGKAIGPLKEVHKGTFTTDAGFSAMAACTQLKQVIRKDSVFLPSTRRAAQTLMGFLVSRFGSGIEKGMPVFWMPNENSEELLGDDADAIERAAEAFEAVFETDCPEMQIFAVDPKGIYSPDGLVDHSDEHIPESLRNKLPSQAKTDLIASGRCLAFNVPTASAFHMWRALEVVFGTYYVKLAGKTFEAANVSRNWGKYIDALAKAGADTKITGNLDHIRAEYRNPVMHPNENLSGDEAFGLFGVGVSAISQVLSAI